MAGATLACGVGANTAVFVTVDSLLLTPPRHVEAPEELVRVGSVANYVDYLRLSSYSDALDIASFTRRTLSLGVGANSLPIRVECVTDTYLPLLGFAPLLGRGFTASKDRLADDGSRGIVLGYGLWRRAFAERESVLGESIRISGDAYTVIGVAPEGFSGVELQVVDAWILLTTSPEACSFTGTNLLRTTDGAWLKTIGRVRADISSEQARADVQALTAADDDELLNAVSRNAGGIELEPFHEFAPGSLEGEARMVLWLIVGATLLYVIACSNVVGLLAVRGIDRRAEVAVRLQLGAPRRLVVAQAIAENMTVAFLGVPLSWMVALWLGALLGGFFPHLPTTGTGGIRAWALLLGLTLLAGAVTGAVAAVDVFRLTSLRTCRSLRYRGLGSSRAHKMVLVCQMCLGFVLLACAGVFLRSVLNLGAAPGYDVDAVVVVPVELQQAGYDMDEHEAVFARLADRIRALPGVEVVALSSGEILGFGEAGWATIIRRSPTAKSEIAFFYAVSDDYFAALGTNITNGREFVEADAGSPVAVVDIDLAGSLVPDEDAVGKCVYIGVADHCTEIVGTLPSRRSSSLRRQSREVFVPTAQARLYGRDSYPKTLFVRWPRSPDTAATQIAIAVHDEVAGLPFVDVQPLAELANVQTRSSRLAATVLGLFGVLAVPLGGIGVYGLLSLSVRQRSASLGLRMALGASPTDLVRAVVRETTALVAIALAIGSGLAFAVSRLVESLLFEAPLLDWQVFGAAGLVVATMAFAGAAIPALTVAATNPLVALRRD